MTSAGRIMVKAVGNIFFNVNAANITISPAAARRRDPVSFFHRECGCRKCHPQPQFCPAIRINRQPGRHASVIGSFSQPGCVQFRYDCLPAIWKRVPIPYLHLPGKSARFLHLYQVSRNLHIVDLYTGSYTREAPVRISWHPTVPTMVPVLPSPAP